jgi:hypothetical protein
LTIDRHALAVVSIIGCSLDVLGSLYLAYDLLGGEHGPLRTLTRAVTYGLLFGIGFGVALGPVFGLVSGAAHGITLAWELSRTARHRPRPGFWYEAAMSAFRGGSYALGASWLFGVRFGITFGALSTVGQVVAYQAGIRPSLDYAPATRLGMSRHQFLAAVNRTVGYAIAGYISALVADQRARALLFGLETGLVVGVVTAIVNTCMPLVEWTADHMPAKRMGVIGIGLILIGFLLQSVQYWVALLDASVR